MTARVKRPRGRAALLAVLFAASALAACGDTDFKNDPRPPLPLNVTGVIQDSGITVSPAKIGAGPVVLTLSNQTDGPHELILQGGSVNARIGPVPATAAGTIRRTLAPGDYEVSAGSEEAVPEEIKPAKLTVGPERPSSSTDLQLP